jgi:hypothetical protein
VPAAPIADALHDPGDVQCHGGGPLTLTEDRIFSDEWIGARKESGISIPLSFVSHKFKMKVTKEMKIARERAHETLGLVPRAQAPYAINGRYTPLTPRRGHCKACGCDWDTWTDGCEGCVARHSMRQTLMRRRRARDQLHLNGHA